MSKTQILFQDVLSLGTQLQKKTASTKVKNNSWQKRMFKSK